MFVIEARNVNDAWHNAKRVLNLNHVVRPSRNGEVWEYPSAVATVYHQPLERVLFDPVRDANPFFHFFESLWMLAGRNDVEFVAQFVNRMREYSDDGSTFHGAYGYRWKQHFSQNGVPLNQLSRIVNMLRANPDERRAVLQMWDSAVDLDQPGVRDLPCNTQVYFKVRNGRLCSLVTCRSNDLVWGCYGANSVHFSFLLEYIAARSGYPVGTYTQVSDSWHAYTDKYTKYGGMNTNGLLDPYTETTLQYQRLAEPFPLMDDPINWDADLARWMNGVREGLSNRIFPGVATPLMEAFRLYKQRDLYGALRWAGSCEATDWRLACQMWLQRRIDRAKNRQEA